MDNTAKAGKRAISLVLALAIIAMLVPLGINTSANTSVIPDLLPFESQIKGSVSTAQDVSGRNSVVIFGRVSCGNTTGFLRNIDGIVEKYGLEYEIRPVFFDIDQPIDVISDFFDSNQLPSISAFAGGRAEMWSLLRERGITTTITLPAVFYVSSNGTSTLHSTGPQSSGAILANISTLLGRNIEETSHVPVTGITGIPATLTAMTPLTLLGTVSPPDATNKTITWTVVNAGTTGAAISGSTLTAVAAGNVTVRAEIANGTAAGTNYSQTFVITVRADILAPSNLPDILPRLPFENHVAGDIRSAIDVTGRNAVVIFGRVNCANTTVFLQNINDLVAMYGLGNEIFPLYFDIDQPLDGINRYFASNSLPEISVFSSGRAAMWSLLRERGITSAITLPAVFYVSGSGAEMLRSTGPQTSGTILSGLSTLLGQNIEETILIPVTDIAGVLMTATAMTPLTLTGAVLPASATNKEIIWTVENAGTTRATISGSILSAAASGMVTVRATIANGTAEGIDYTQTFLIAVRAAHPSDPFTMSVDNYRFGNSHASFGYNSNYSITIERFLEIFSPAAAQIYSSASSPWRGNCYGIAATAYAFETYRLQHLDFQDGINRTYGFSSPNSPNSPLTKLIELYQISQFLPDLWNETRAGSSNFNNLSALVSAVDNEDGLIVCIRGASGGHAVVAYGVESLGGTKYSIKIYDSNQPNNLNLRLEVDTSMSDSAGWSFSGADTQDYNTRFSRDIAFIYGDVIFNAVERASETKSTGLGGMQLIVPVNAEVSDTRGVNVENLAGANVFIPLGALPLNPDGSDPTPQRNAELWIVPADEYTVELEGDESTSISVFDGSIAYSINLLPEENNITVEVGEVVGIDGAVHGNITQFFNDGTERVLPVIAAQAVSLTPGGLMESAEFSDVREDDWFESAVKSAATVGIVQGVGSNRFDPQGRLTVSQWVTMLMRIQYGRMPGGVPWFETYMQQAQRDAIIFDSDRFDPEENVTRAQAALIITRYIEIFNPRWVKDRAANTPVDLGEVPGLYLSAVEDAYAWNIIRGDQNNRFNPQNTLTRAEAAQILYNYFRIVD